MSAPAPRRRKPAAPTQSKPVKCSIPLRVEVHAKLAAAAALRGMPAGALAAEFIADQLRHIVIIDRRKADADFDSPVNESAGAA